MAAIAAHQELEHARQAMESLQLDAAVAHLSAAIRGFTAEGDHCQAGLACAQLGGIFASFLGNLTVGRAWFARATRLVQDLEPCIEQGWVAVAPMGCDVEDPAELLARADLALDRARRFGDVNLEMKALADAGLAHVQTGRLAEGMALLDEAMALACGTADDEQAVGMSACSLFTACYHAADFDRAGSWAAVLRERGLIGAAPGSPAFLSGHCDSVQATLLFELGRWTEAEKVLTRAMADFEASMGGPSWHPAIALADLRIHQGRLADAEVLLLGKDAAVQALLPTARLHLARGDHELARAAARRGLRALAGDRLRAAELLAVLVEAELALDHIEAALEAAGDLDRRLSDVPVATLRAKSAAVHARALAAGGRHDDAVELLQEAVDALPPGGAPWCQMRLHLQLARLHDHAGDRPAAVVEARAASALLDGLDVVVAPEDSNTLSQLAGDVPAAPDPDGHTATTAHTATLRRDGRWWDASHAGTTVRLADTKGLRYLAELLARPGSEQHVLDLVDRVEGVDPTGAIDRRRLGDAGEAADAAARTQYRRRVEALRAEIDDALADGHDERACTLQEELDQLVAQLAQAFGLGGRERKAASAAERARLNVTRALRAATTKLAEALPEAGAAADRGLRTGTYCAYQPEVGGLRWIVHP